MNRKREKNLKAAIRRHNERIRLNEVRSSLSDYEDEDVEDTLDTDVQPVGLVDSAMKMAEEAPLVLDRRRN